MATFSYLNLNYLFYSCTNLASVNGLGNLSGVRSMRYTFSGCSHMTTIYADSTWALPTSGITGSQCFYSCRALVGGNGTAWSSSNVGYTYMRIDRAGQTGYLTAA